MEERILLPAPGIFNWNAFPQDLRLRLERKYDHVIVCHEGSRNKVGDLLEIASASGSRIWDFDVWRHSIHSVSSVGRSQYLPQPQTEEATA
jgi:hypothetical protein